MSGNYFWSPNRTTTLGKMCTMGKCPHTDTTHSYTPPFAYRQALTHFSTALVRYTVLALGTPYSQLNHRARLAEVAFPSLALEAGVLKTMLTWGRVRGEGKLRQWSEVVVAQHCPIEPTPRVACSPVYLRIGFHPL